MTVEKMSINNSYPSITSIKYFHFLTDRHFENLFFVSVASQKSFTVVVLFHDRAII